jgi:hypothetical protein
MSIVEFTALLANVSLVLSLVVALIVGFLQTQAAGRDRRERLTLETLEFVQSREFAEFIFIINANKIAKTNAERQAQPDDDKIRFIQFAQQMESLGMLVVDGVIDLGLVEKTLGSFVITAWEAYKPVISEMRVTTNDPYLAEYFQSLAELMDKRLNTNPRVPAYKVVRA